MLGVSLDNLLFLLLVAVAALFQLLSKLVTKPRKRESGQTSAAPAPTDRPIQQVPRESDSDRIRKFLEALGQPPSSTPPRPVLPRTDIPPRPLAPVQPPPVSMPRTFRLPQERRRNRDSAKEQRRQPEYPTNFPQTVPPYAATPPLPAFEVHKQLPVEVERPPGIKSIIEPQTPTSQSVGSRQEVKTNIAALLASNATLQQGVLLCEILGAPRGLQPLVTMF
jgi:hypothetical protein